MVFGIWCSQGFRDAQTHERTHSIRIGYKLLHELSLLACIAFCCFLHAVLLGLSHWDPYAVHRGGYLELYYCNMVGWFWWDSSLISTTNWFPSVLWFGHLTCKNRPRNDLLCVEWDVKPYTLTHTTVVQKMFFSKPITYCTESRTQVNNVVHCLDSCLPMTTPPLFAPQPHSDWSRHCIYQPTLYCDCSTDKEHIFKTTCRQW